MLCPADTDLVRRDPALPGLALLLDPDAFAADLRQAVPGIEVEGGRITYVRYKPGTSCLVGYRLAAAGYEAARVGAGPFGPGGPFRRAEVLGYSDRHCLLALGWLPGRLLSEALADPAFPPGAVTPVGAALAGLHAQAPAGLPLRTREE